MPKKKAPSKCSRVTNPCKICFETVTEKTGLQCKGACKKWAHFKCLNYTPGKILDIQSGYIQVNCPCPNCASNMKEYQLRNLPRFCGKAQCPASKLPVCEFKGCPSKKPGQGKRCPEDCTDLSKDEVSQSVSSTVSSDSNINLICKKVSPLSNSSTADVSIENSESTLVISLPETPISTDTELLPKRNAQCQKDTKRLHRKHKAATKKRCAATQQTRSPQKEASLKRYKAKTECKVNYRDKEVYMDSCFFPDQCALKKHFNGQFESDQPSLQSYTDKDTLVPRNCRSVNMQSSHTYFEGQNFTSAADSEKSYAGLDPTRLNEKSCQQSLLAIQSCPEAALTSAVILSIESSQANDIRDNNGSQSDSHFHISLKTRKTIANTLECMYETMGNIHHQFKGLFKKMLNAFETTSRSSCS